MYDGLVWLGLGMLCVALLSILACVGYIVEWHIRERKQLRRAQQALNSKLDRLGSAYDLRS